MEWTPESEVGTRHHLGLLRPSGDEDEVDEVIVSITPDRTTFQAGGVRIGTIATTALEWRRIDAVTWQVSVGGLNWHFTPYDVDRFEQTGDAIGRGGTGAPTEEVVIDLVTEDARGDPGPSSTPLTTIRGIGPAYAQKLAAVGVRSVEDLAAISDARRATVTAIVGRRLESERWVDQAREIAAIPART